MSPRLAIFDCDGTLVDSGADIIAAMNRAFEAEGLAPPLPEATRAIVGLSLPQALAVLAPGMAPSVQAHLAEGYKEAFRAMRNAGEVGESLYDGILHALDALLRKGWLLGIATGKSDRGLGHCLERHGLTGHFATVQTADRHPSKPHPSMIKAALAQSGVPPERSAVIGDTSYDMAMASAAGSLAVGVTWGYHSEAELIGAGAQRIAQAPANLLAILETVG